MSEILNDYIRLHFSENGALIKFKLLLTVSLPGLHVVIENKFLQVKIFLNPMKSYSTEIT